MMNGLADDLLDYPEFVPDVENYVPSNCNYMNVEELSYLIFGVSLSILIINIRSCRKNFDHFIEHFQENLFKFSLIIFTETWLTPDYDNIFSIPGYNCHNLYRNQYGGGIKLYVKNCIKAKIIDNFCMLHDLCEMLTIELLLDNHKIMLSSIYHPPTSCHNKNIAFVDLLSLQIREFLHCRVPLIIAGDLNINILNPNNYAYVDMYIRNLFELGLKPLVTIPTRVVKNNLGMRFTILDQVWASHNLQSARTFVIPIDITDHFPVGTIIMFPFYRQSIATSNKSRPLTCGGKELFAIFLSNINIVNINDDPSDTYDTYFKKVFECYNIAFPLRNLSIKSKQPSPWITSRLKECIKKKAKLYRLFLRGRISRGDYTTYRNRLTNALRRSKALYYANEFLEKANSSKLLWSFINDILNKRSKQTLKRVVVDGVVLNGRLLADYINSYFVNIASSITRGLPEQQRYVCLSMPVRESCFLYPTCIMEVMKIIKRMKNHGSKLLDIHPSIVKENVILFANHFVELYNFSIVKTVFPRSLKIARVTPCYKSGLVDLVDNYRPISVLPIFSKVFETLTLNRMNNFIERHSILTTCQFGFRKGRSTTQAVVKLLSHIIEAFHRRIYSACFFLDLRKAFDTVNHALLFQKLQHYGFRGQSLDYLRSYYTNRQQYVKVDHHDSSSLPVSSGVPQGSILGPLCFSLFINDMPLAVDEATVLFADDAAFIVTSPTLEGLYMKIIKLLSDLTEYLNINKLVPNSSKSKLMMFTSRPTGNLLDISFGGEIIEWVKDFKYLGLTITHNLSFSKHISNVSLNVSRITGSFVNLRTMVPLQILIRLFYALVFPHMINHIIIWGSAPQSHMSPLNVRVNNLLRVILGVRRINGRPIVSVNDMYGELGLLKLGSLFKFNLYKFLRLLIAGELPDLATMLLGEHLITHTYNTRQVRFRHPALICETERRAIPHQLIVLYEGIPSEIMNMNLGNSLRAYKRYLFNRQNL